MTEDLGGISGSRPAGQAPSGLDAPRIDPGRMSDPWRQMVADACRDAKREACGGKWLVAGTRADNLGAQAMQLVADTTGLAVIPTGPSDYHEGKTFTQSTGETA